MATTFDGLQAESKNHLEITKAAFNFAVANRWYSTLTAAGSPAPGSSTLSVQSTGELVTQSTAGFPGPLSWDRNGSLGLPVAEEVSFGAAIGPTGPIVRAQLWRAVSRYGTYAFNANTAVSDVGAGAASAAPWLWIEIVTAVTGTLNVNVNTPGTTLTVSLSAPAAGTFWPIRPPNDGISSELFAGISFVNATTATAGSFNLWVMEPRWSGAVGPGLPTPTRVRDGLNELGGTGLLLEWDAAILPLVRSTATGIVPLDFEIVTSTGVS